MYTTVCSAGPHNMSQHLSLATFAFSPFISSANTYLSTCHLPKGLPALGPQEEKQDLQSGESRDSEAVVSMQGTVTTLGPSKRDTNHFDGSRGWGCRPEPVLES